MNVDIILIRDFIQTNGLYIQLLACLAYIIYVRKFTAFLYCLLLIIVFAPVHFLLEKQILSMTSSPDYQHLGYNLWYLGFAYTDALIVILTIIISKKKVLQIDSITRMILISYVFLGVSQVARYFDRIILESNKLGDLYSIIVPTINVSITLLIFGYVAYLVIIRQSKYRK